MKEAWQKTVCGAGFVLCILAFTMPPTIEGAYELHLIGGVGVTLMVATVFDIMLGVERRLSLWFYGTVFVFVSIGMLIREIEQINTVAHTFEYLDIVAQEIGAIFALLYVRLWRPSIVVSTQ